MNEFELIKRYFAPLASEFPGALSLVDDAAVLDVPTGQQLVVTKDAISEGIHFIGNEDPALIAQKLLRTNLSDLAAKGAEPYCYFLALMLPLQYHCHSREGGNPSHNVMDPRVKPEDDKKNFIARFAQGLVHDKKTYGIHIAGGDTIATKGTLSFSLTAMGLVPHGQMLKRSGAQVGDTIYVTGTIGDSALGLRIAQNQLPQAAILSEAEKQFLIDRYLLPQPRTKEGLALRGVAHAAMDISDGLIQDLGHLCKASGLGAEIHLENIPLSGPARKLVEQDPSLWPLIYNGGDDYELLYTAMAAPHTAIGHITQTHDIRLISGGAPIPIASGYKHFTG